jgi:hypothetical protein
MAADDIPGSGEALEDAVLGDLYRGARHNMPCTDRGITS